MLTVLGITAPIFLLIALGFASARAGLVNREHLTDEEKARFDFDLAKANYLKSIEGFRKAGIWTPDLSPLFDERDVETPYYFQADHHWTPAGAERTARLVAETLKDVPGFADIEKKEFASTVTGLLPKAGTLHKTAAQFCGTSYATQYVERYETEPVGEASADSLFGDEANPQIALVGTSNSGPAYNFAGFLQQHGRINRNNTIEHREIDRYFETVGR